MGFGDWLIIGELFPTFKAVFLEIIWYAILIGLFGILIITFVVLYLDKRVVDELLSTEIEKSKRITLLLSLIFIVILLITLLINAIFLDITITFDIFSILIILSAFDVLLAQVIYIMNKEKGYQFFKIIVSFIVAIGFLSPGKKLSGMSSGPLFYTLVAMGLVGLLLVKLAPNLKEIIEKKFIEGYILDFKNRGKGAPKIDSGIVL